MAAVANIVLNDGLASPVAHTFVPVAFDGSTGTWWFEDQAPASPIGYNRISMQLIRPKNPSAGQDSGDRMYRAKLSIHEPTLETLGTNDAGVTPPPTVAYIVRANIEVLLPERSSYQSREDIRLYASQLMTNTQVIALIETLTAPF